MCLPYVLRRFHHDSWHKAKIMDGGPSC
jgi:hypothetical protein